MDEQVLAEHAKRIETGDKIKSFLESELWTLHVKPILDSFVKGLIDARDIDITSDKKASIEVKSRVLAAKYIESIEKLLEAQVIDGEQSKRMLTKVEDKAPLYKRRQY